MSEDTNLSIPCGIYRTTKPIDDQVPANALVYYHNHGSPGPGVYLPRSWHNNHAQFQEHGTTVPDSSYAATLQPLLPEGFYRVVEPFHCCASRCQLFEQDLLVQLGYNGDAQAILFKPELVEGALATPAKGTIVDEERLALLGRLKIPVSTTPAPTTGGQIH